MITQFVGMLYRSTAQPISGMWALCCGSAEACGSCKQRISIVDEALTGLVFWVSSVTSIGGVVSVQCYYFII